MGARLTEIAPRAGGVDTASPRVRPELCADEGSLGRDLTGPDPGQPGSMPLIEPRSSEGGVVEVHIERLDIVAGGIQDLRSNAHARETIRPQVAVPAPPGTLLLVEKSLAQGLASHVKLPAKLPPGHVKTPSPVAV